MVLCGEELCHNGTQSSPDSQQLISELNSNLINSKEFDILAGNTFHFFVLLFYAGAQPYKRSTIDYLATFVNTFVMLTAECGVKASSFALSTALWYIEYERHYFSDFFLSRDPVVFALEC